MSQVKLAAFAILGVLSVPVAGRATTYDAVSSFALSPASASPFSYGFRIGATGFTLYDAATASCAGIAGLACNYSSSFNSNMLPAVGRNTTGALIQTGSVRVPTDELFLHPVGQNSGLAAGDTVVRFTAPSAGLYLIGGLFQILDVSASGVAVSVEGGTSAFLQALTGPLNTQAAFGFSTVLMQNQTLDFVVNSAGSYNNDSTGLVATITSVPEPVSLVLMGAGLFGVAVLRRRRG